MFRTRLDEISRQKQLLENENFKLEADKNDLDFNRIKLCDQIKGQENQVYFLSNFFEILAFLFNLIKPLLY